MGNVEEPKIEPLASEEQKEDRQETMELCVHRAPGKVHAMDSVEAQLEAFNDPEPCASCTKRP